MGLFIAVMPLSAPPIEQPVTTTPETKPPSTTPETTPQPTEPVKKPWKERAKVLWGDVSLQ
jgi:hypothetical protein